MASANKRGLIVGNIRLLIITVATVTAVTTVAACSSGSSDGTNTASASLELTNLTIGAVPVSDEAGLYVAQAEGYFKAAGLNVKIDPIVSSATAIDGMNSGRYDITAGNSVSYVEAQVAHQANLEIAAVGSLMQPGTQALYTLPGSAITTIAKLPGKRIGVNVIDNIGTLLISELLESHGVSPDSVTFVQVAGSFGAMDQALAHHSIDVAWLPEPFGSMGQVNDGVQELADLDQGASQNFPVSWYVVTKSWASKHPKTLTAFLGALRRGQQFADRDRQMVEQVMTGLPSPYGVPAMVASVMSLDTYPLITAPDIQVGSVQQVANLMYELHMLTSTLDLTTMLRP